MPSVAARPWSSCAPTTEKKISVDSTPKLPPRMMGLPKSAMDSMNVIRNALAIPGRISGSEMSTNVRHCPARSVCAASSRAGETPSTTPISTRKAMGVNAKIWRDKHALQAIEPPRWRDGQGPLQQLVDESGSAKEQDEPQSRRRTAA